MKCVFGLLTLLVMLVSLPRCEAQQARTEDIEFFERKVRPLLIERCFECHSQSAKKLKGGLMLDSRASILIGGDNGSAADPGKPDSSLLVEAIRYEQSDLQMPPSGKLADEEISVIEQWIGRGMPYTSDHQVETARQFVDLEAGRKYWAFQPLAPAIIPSVKNQSWPRNRIDRFILAKLEQLRIEPSEEAAWRVLVRRAKFDLLGLPPTPVELDSAANRDSSEAYRGLIASWLASPHYGERWGRYWLDLARYCDIPEVWADVKGNAYHYRDWIVKAINDDMPYDRFMQCQIAADLMPDTLPQDRAALGFLGLSPSYWKELQLPVEIIKTIVSDEYEERVHTLSSTFLGLNIACARCHDHKYDPITAEDYYALAGIFASTRQTDRAMIEGIDDEKVLAAREQVNKLDVELKKLVNKKSDKRSDADNSKIAELEAEIAKLKSIHGYDAQLTPAVRDASLQVVNAEGTHGSRLKYNDRPRDLAVEIRGNPNRPGEIVPRRFVSVLSKGEPARFSQGSGRYELSQRLASDAAALVARVFVNRVWKHHFGVGIVDTPSDFGVQGDKPSHPELLEDLAHRFVSSGWSLKWLHREIVLSATYRQACGPAFSGDADFRFYSRFQRRRLDVEAWRDAMLFASGSLDASLGGPPIELGKSDNHRRTVYGTVRRRELSDLLRLHDFPDPITHSPNRIPTITPLQQLFALNGPLMMDQAAAFVARLEAEVGSDDSQRIDRAYELSFGRGPTAQERRLALAFVRCGDSTAWQQYVQVLLGSNEFMFVD